MPRTGYLDPLPSVIAPERTLLISAGSDEFDKSPVCDVEGVDRKFWDEGLMCIKFVIPSERKGPIGFPAQSGNTSRDIECIGCGQAPNSPRNSRSVTPAV